MSSSTRKYSFKGSIYIGMATCSCFLRYFRNSFHKDLFCVLRAHVCVCMHVQWGIRVQVTVNTTAGIRHSGAGIMEILMWVLGTEYLWENSKCS